MDRRRFLQIVASIAPAVLLTRQATVASRFQVANNLRLHYLDWGNAGARPLVLLHAAPLNAHAWDGFARTMAPSFHVVAPDARGFGESEWSSEYRPDMMVEDLHRLAMALGLTGSVVCGNEMGGSIAMAFAGKYPDLVERLILVDTGPTPAPNPQIPPGPFSSREAALAQVTAVAGPQLARMVTNQNLKQDGSGAWQWRYDHKGIGAGFDRPIDWPAVKCPTLVLRGARSQAFSQAEAEAMVRENPNATLVVIPDAGHFTALEQPARFEKAVRGWLGA